jgi:tRNA uridine 5-carbamoylmethylation protein Kti12
MPKQTTPTDYLYELDRITQKIISELNGMQSDGLSVNIMGKIVNLARKFTLLELNRIRRKFITLHKMNTLNSNDIGPLFLEYLNVCVN